VNSLFIITAALATGNFLFFTGRLNWGYKYILWLHLKEYYRAVVTVQFLEEIRIEYYNLTRGSPNRNVADCAFFSQLLLIAGVDSYIVL